MKTKSVFLLGFLFFLTSVAFSQEKKEPYNVSLDGVKQLNQAVAKAKIEKKHVLVQVGGNWCPWCIKFNNFCHDVPRIDSIISDSYVFIHLNYSKENKNMPAMEKLGFPQRFGFPVLVVLNAKGERLHTQDSGLLESGKGYDTTKVVTFLHNWSPEVLKPERYKAASK